MIDRRSATFLAALAVSMAVPASAGGQILDKIREKAGQAAEKVERAAEVADRVGSAVVPISTEQEIVIGRGIAATVAGHYGIVRDPALTRYVNLVGSTVASIAPRPDIVYRFAVLDTDEVNAFAAPGGYVFVTRGALGTMRDEATLAAVLAHEVGHVDGRDVVREIQSKARTALGIEEAAERVDITGEEYLRKAIETGAGALFMGLSREDELGADAFAVKAAAAAGYDPGGLVRFLESLATRSGEEDLSLLEKTHPGPEERLEAARRSIQALGSKGDAGIVAEERLERSLAGAEPPAGS